MKQESEGKLSGLVYAGWLPSLQELRRLSSNSQLRGGSGTGPVETTSSVGMSNEGPRLQPKILVPRERWATEFLIRVDPLYRERVFGRM